MMSAITGNPKPTSQDATAKAVSTQTLSTQPKSAMLRQSPPLGTQLDVDVVDNYLHSLLLTKFLQSLDPLLHTLSSNDISQYHQMNRTLRMVLSSILTAGTLWMTQLQTPATKALGLQTMMLDSTSGVGATKWKYICCASLLPLGYHLLQQLVLELQRQNQQAENDESLLTQASTSSSLRQRQLQQMRRIARERQYQTARYILEAIRQGLPVLKVGLLLSLLLKPNAQTLQGSVIQPSTPRLSMILSGLAFVSSIPTATTSNNSSTSSESTASTAPATVSRPGFYVLYAHRRWLYEETLKTFRQVFGPLMSSLQDWRQIFLDWYVVFRKEFFQGIVFKTCYLLTFHRTQNLFLVSVWLA